ncbi:MAG: lipoyl(octanoyl) transferase LipB [Pseudomonadota bacterium]|nr:lipoyl(octanoyl) transferase LipB [Pseudomonadota bacterium]
MQSSPCVHISPEWITSTDPVPYHDAIAVMEAHVEAMIERRAGERIWLLEHPPLYTAGTSARPEEVLDSRLPVHMAGRGGKLTWHGPGQRVAYVMLDLTKRGRDLRAYVALLEDWVIAALARFDIDGQRRSGRVGIWVDTPRGEAKIAAIGVRVRRWITWHGVAVNVNPDLSYFDDIVPCGLHGYGVTSLQAIGVQADLAQMDAALKESWMNIFDHVQV